MTRFLAAVVFIALTSSTPPASALQSDPDCCACLPEGAFAQSGATNHTAGPTALFCAAGVADALRERCDALPAGNLVCLLRPDANAGLAGDSCVARLADAGITCPTTGAPTASGATLMTLAVVLGALGALVLRRRA